MSVAWPMEPKHVTAFALGIYCFELLGEQCARLREQHERRCGLVVPGVLGGLQMAEVT